MKLAAGTRLGPYELVSVLGAGGMGEVYRARDTRLDRTVAIKVLPSHVRSNPGLRERFEREARAVAALNHPNICTVHDVGHQDGTDFLVMECLEGETLADRLAKRGEAAGLPLRLDEALAIAIQMADALDKAHRAGIVHRDLKPGNIMLVGGGRRGGPSGPPTAKLLDFGLAKVTPAVVAASGLSVAPTLQTPVTMQGMILGTLQYMAPEQIEGQEADARTDIFAFGCVLYEMLTGKKAFEGKTQASLIGAILKDNPQPISNLQPLTPAALDRVVTICLAKEPDDRWQSAGDLLRELQWIATGTSQAASTAPAVSRHHAREYAAWGLAGLATLAAIGMTVLLPRGASQANAIVRFMVSPPFGTIRTNQSEFAVAPDGQSLAFVARSADGVFRIFVRRLDAAEALLVSGTDRGELPFWAPDSRSIGFAREGGLYRIDLDGSAPRRLSDVPGNTFRGGSWSSRGVIVFASASGLLRIPDTGGTPAPLTTLDHEAKEVSHSGPWFLPDGRHVLFLALAAGSRGTIWATAVDDPARVRIIESSGAAEYVDGWIFSTTLPPRSLVAQRFDPERLALQGAPQAIRDRLTGATTGGYPGFGVSSNGVLVVDRPPPVLHQLTWMDRTGRTLGTLGPNATINSFALAPDERRVVAEVADNDSLQRNLWLFDPGREEGTRLTYEASARRPMWAPDGRHVYFSQAQDAARPFGLRALTIGATAQTGLENPGGFLSIEDLTRDGRYFVFASPVEPKGIWIQRADNPGERRALIQDMFGAVQPRVSPDRRWLAYTLVLPSEPEIFAQPFDRPGERIQVSVKGGSGAVWSDDSRELYYEGPAGLMAVPIREREGVLDAGPPQKLFALRTQGLATNQPHNLEVAEHGQKFLVNTIVGDSDNVPLEVTLNWTAGLKK